MIEKIIDWSLNNRFLVLLLTGVIIVGGVFAVKNTPLDAIPDLSDVQVIIKTTYPGQAPRVVEDQITYPLTTAMLSVPVQSQLEAILFLMILMFILYLKMELILTGPVHEYLNI